MPVFIKSRRKGAIKCRAKPKTISFLLSVRLGLIHELRLMQCYLMPDETALRELSEGVIEKLKLLTDADFAELEFPLD